MQQVVFHVKVCNTRYYLRIIIIFNWLSYQRKTEFTKMNRGRRNKEAKTTGKKRKIKH